MKKHILGVALFTLIVASFAFIYAFFYSPSIPPKEAVKPPVAQTEAPPVSRTYCNLRSNKFSYEVISSELKGFNLTSKVKVFWNGAGEAPDKIFLRPVLFTLDQKGSGLAIESTAFTKVFDNRNEATLIVLSDLNSADMKIDERQNWYVNFDISKDYPIERYSSPNPADAHQVLFVHKEK